MEEQARLAALRKLPALKGVRTTHIFPGASLLIPRVHPNIADEEIQLPIPIVVEEHRSRPVPRFIRRHPRLRRDVAEPTPALIVKQRQPLAYRRHQQIRSPVVIDVRERSPHAHLARHRHPGLRRHVLKATPAHIAPQLVASPLIRKEQIRSAVPIHIRRRYGRTVIIMNRLIVPSPIIHRHLSKRNPALRCLIFELKPMEHLPRRRSAPLAFTVRLQPQAHGILQRRIWNLNHRIGGPGSSHQRQDTDTRKPVGEGHGEVDFWHQHTPSTPDSAKALYPSPPQDKPGCEATPKKKRTT